MPRPMQHPHQAPRGTACNVACGTLLPLSTSRKHAPVTAGHRYIRDLATKLPGAAGAWASRRARRGRVSAADVGAPRAAQPEPGRPGGDVCCRRGMSIACTAWSPVSFSPPRTTWTTDCPCRWSLAKAAASAAVAMPRRGQYSRAAGTPRAFRAWPVPCPRRQARPRLTMQHCGALGSWLRRQ